MNHLADDTLILKNIPSSIQGAQDNLNAVDNWVKANKFATQPTKSKINCFDSIKLNCDALYGDEKLNPIDCWKHLGIHIDSTQV